MDFILRDNFFASTAELLHKYFWIVYKNESLLPFYTSDNPVALGQWFVYPEGALKCGLATIGVTIAIPLSSEYLLACYEPAGNDRMAQYANECIALKQPRQVKPYNELQIWQAGRFIFSKTDDFDHAKSFLSMNPHLTEKMRS
jgi:hypothetical protein